MSNRLEPIIEKRYSDLHSFSPSKLSKTSSLPAKLSSPPPLPAKLSSSPAKLSSSSAKLSSSSPSNLSLSSAYNQILPISPKKSSTSSSPPNKPLPPIPRKILVDNLKLIKKDMDFLNKHIEKNLDLSQITVKNFTINKYFMKKEDKEELEKKIKNYDNMLFSIFYTLLSSWKLLQEIIKKYNIKTGGSSNSHARNLVNIENTKLNGYINLIIHDANEIIMNPNNINNDELTNNINKIKNNLINSFNSHKTINELFIQIRNKYLGTNDKINDIISSSGKTIFQYPKLYGGKPKRKSSVKKTVKKPSVKHTTIVRRRVVKRV